MDRWQRYHGDTAALPPRPGLVRALARHAASGRPPGHALDLGCGGGRDTRALLAAGWTVTAIDRTPGAPAGLPPDPRLVRVTADLATATLAPADLINAQFVLFLLPPLDFAAVWARCRAALRPGGRLCASLLGPADDWAGQPGLTVVEPGALARLLAGLDCECRAEALVPGVTPRGQAKRWHVLHLVARRPE